MVEVIHQLCLEVWETGEWPSDWTKSVFVPLPKKGDLLVCSNYRTISLVSRGSKILLSVIMSRIQNQMNQEISDVQAGFRACRGTRDQIVNLRLITEKAREFNQPLFMCFIDYKKAFDTISHNQLWISMIDMGFLLHIIDLIRKVYVKQQSVVRTVAGTTGLKLQEQ